MIWANLAFIRFFLAWIVMCHHFRNIIPSSYFLSFFDKFDGFAAVLSFLVISGFSIAHSISKRSQKFYQRRLMRIYPLYIFSIFLAFIPFLPIVHSLMSSELSHIDRPTLSNVIGNIFGSQTFVVFPLSSNGAVWSLGVEFFCYLLAPLLMKLRTRQILSLIAISAACYLLFPALQIVQIKNLPYSRFGFPFLMLFWAWLLGFFYFFNHKRLAAKILLVCLGCVAIGMYDRESLAIFTYILTTITLIWSASKNNNFTLPGRVLRAFNYLGELSYPLYLFHVPLIPIILALTRSKEPLTLILSSILFSMLVYHLIDVPIRHRKKLISS